jgi:hypothetical protein
VIESSIYCAATNENKYMKGIDKFKLINPPLALQKLKCMGLSIYLEKKKQTINPFEVDMSDKVVMLLPGDLSLIRVLTNERNREQVDTYINAKISLLEFEVSFKQYFYIQLLLETILE